MGVICFSSLKGGVGKTSLSINIAHAFAQRGCETLLIDTDPLAHATRFFEYGLGRKIVSAAPLAECMFAHQDDLEGSQSTYADAQKLLLQVRNQLTLLPGGEEYHHFAFGKGARVFSRWFPGFLRELSYSYDHIIIDTAPEFNVVTRSVLAASDLVAVPVDSSAMGLHGLEALVSSASHIKVPGWCIVRTMVDRRASRVQRLSSNVLRNSMAFKTSSVSQDESYDRIDVPLENSDDISPIFLLNNVVFRTELQNLLSYLGNTSFEYRGSRDLARAYHVVACELERVITLVEPSIADADSEVQIHDYA